MDPKADQFPVGMLAFKAVDRRHSRTQALLFQPIIREIEQKAVKVQICRRGEVPPWLTKSITVAGVTRRDQPDDGFRRTDF
jgi:hypothetical protein